MNMASIVILFLFTVLSVTAGNADYAFVTVQCKTENVGQHSQQSLLECVIQTRNDVKDAKILVVIWKKEGAEKALLTFNREVTTLQPGYSFAEPSWHSKNMNVSLLIANTAVKDEGTYQCVVMTDSGDNSNSTSLKVTAKYNTPTINSIPEAITLNTAGTLMCHTEGGYPKGQLRWFDKDNREVEMNTIMEAKQTDSGLFNLSSELSLHQGSFSSKYTCVVFNASGGREEEATFEVPDVPISGGQKGTGLDQASKIVAPVVVIGSLIVGLLLLLVYRWRSRRRYHQEVPAREPEDEEGDHRERDKTFPNGLV